MMTVATAGEPTAQAASSPRSRPDLATPRSPPAPPYARAATPSAAYLPHAPPSQVAPSGVCERTEAEHMPMLLLVPHLSSPPVPAGAAPPEPQQSFGMLGLGDVVPPHRRLPPRRISPCTSDAPPS